MKALDSRADRGASPAREDVPGAARWTGRRRPALGAAVGAAAIVAGALSVAGGPRQTLVRGGADPARPPTVVERWNEAALEAIRTTRPSPPVAARALAILHTTIFDAWAPYDAAAVGTATPAGGPAARRPPPERSRAHKRAAVSHAAHVALTDLFPSRAGAFDAVLAELGYASAERAPGPHFEPDAAAGQGPAAVGTAAARAVLASRRQDGANQAGNYADTTGYAPVNSPDEVRDPNRWQPLRVPDGQGGSRVQECVVPHWRLVRPFALSSGSALRPARGPRRSSEEGYLAQAGAILRLSAGLTDRQKAIAEYWADGPATELPPGHWCLLARHVSRRDGHDLDADVVLYFALANALLDAGIAAWDAKWAYDSVRPVTAIRHLFRGRPVPAWAGPQQETRTLDGADWHPYQPATFVTPAFPEFVSGHSTFSAAAAEVLQRFTGRDDFGAEVTVRAGSSAIEPGRTPGSDVRLRWETFSAAAAEAGMSRRYGGIHFEEGDLHGQAMGRAVGGAVWARVQAHLRGTP